MSIGDDERSLFGEFVLVYGAQTQATSMFTITYPLLLVLSFPFGLELVELLALPFLAALETELLDLLPDAECYRSSSVHVDTSIVWLNIPSIYRSSIAARSVWVLPPMKPTHFASPQ